MRRLKTKTMENVNGGLLDRGEVSQNKFPDIQSLSSHLGLNYTNSFAQFASTLGNNLGSNYLHLNQLLEQFKSHQQDS